MSSESAATNASKSFFFGLIFKIYIAEAREYRLDNKILLYVLGVLLLTGKGLGNL